MKTKSIHSYTYSNFMHDIFSNMDIEGDLLQDHKKLAESAPDLLDACKYAQAVLGDIVRYDDDEDVTAEKEAYRIIKQVIQKAEGN